MNIFDWLGLESASEANRKHKELIKRIMKAEEAIAKLEQANRDQAEAFVELNKRIKELEDLVANADLPADVAAKIEEVSLGAKALADVIQNTQPPPPPSE